MNVKINVGASDSSPMTAVSTLKGKQPEPPCVQSRQKGVTKLLKRKAKHNLKLKYNYHSNPGQLKSGRSMSAVRLHRTDHPEAGQEVWGRRQKKDI